MDNKKGFDIGCAKLALAFLITVALLSASGSAQPETYGCCANPLADSNIICDDDYPSTKSACCPTNNPLYYSTDAGKPRTQLDCELNFFSSNGCTYLGSKCGQGCCCTENRGGEPSPQSNCQGTWVVYPNDGRDCTGDGVCPKPKQCADHVDNDNNGCSDHPTDTGCWGEADTEESGGVCQGQEGAGCELSTFTPTISSFTVSPQQGQKRFSLQWSLDQCNSQADSFDIFRCEGNACTAFPATPITTVGRSSTSTSYAFVDSSPLLKFDTDYTYKIVAKFGYNRESQKTAGGNLGNLECYGKTDSAKFCITAYSYLSLAEIVAAKFGIPSAQVTLAWINAQPSFSSKFKKGYSCDSSNHLREEIACQNQQLCLARKLEGDTQRTLFCVPVDSCSDKSDEPACLGTSTQKRYCFFDKGVSPINSCYRCDPGMSCYDYKSKDACDKNNCALDGCSWTSLYDQLGIGVCVDTAKENCKWCNKPGTLGLDSTIAYNNIFDRCTQQKSELLSTSSYPCYFNQAAFESKPCDSLVCTDISGCPSTISLGAGNELPTATTSCARLNMCGQFTEGCKKDADGNSIADCTTAECESDIYRPETTLTPVYASNGALRTLIINILDKTSSTGQLSAVAPGSSYTTFFCYGASCPDRHTSANPFPKSTTSLELNYMNRNFWEKDYSKIVFSLPAGVQTLKFFAQDPSKNLGLIESTQITVPLFNDPPRVKNITDETGIRMKKIGNKLYTQPFSHLIVNFVSLPEQQDDDVLLTYAELKKSDGTIILPSSPILPLTSSASAKESFRLGFNSPIPDGSYTLSIQAKTKDGKVSMESPDTFEIVVDGAPPSLSSSTPARGETRTSPALIPQLIFNKEVTLDYVKLNGVDITSTFPPSADNKIFTSPQIALIEGNNQKMDVRVLSLTGVAHTETITFHVNAKPLNITLISPKYGVGQSPSFEVSLATDNKAECHFKLSLAALSNPTTVDMLNSFFSTTANITTEDTNGQIHTILQSQLQGIPPDPSSIYLYAVCKDFFLSGTSGIKVVSVNLSYDNSPPTITSSFADPAIISDYEPDGVSFKTFLKIQANEKVACNYAPLKSASTPTPSFEDMKPSTYFSTETFNAVNHINVSVLSDGIYYYGAICQNKALLKSTPTTLSFTVNRNQPLTIDTPIDEYAPLSTGIIPLPIETNKKSNCYYSFESQSQAEYGTDFITPNGLTHSKNIEGLIEGTHTAYVFCRDTVGMTATLAITFIKDISPPDMVTVNDSSTGENIFGNLEQTCVNTTLRVNVSAFDPHTNVKVYNVTLYKGSVSSGNFVGDIAQIRGETDDYFQFDISHLGFELKDKTKYLFRAKAQNQANLWSLYLNSNGIMVNTSACASCGDEKINIAGNEECDTNTFFNRSCTIDSSKIDPPDTPHSGLDCTPDGPNGCKKSYARCLEAPKCGDHTLNKAGEMCEYDNNNFLIPNDKDCRTQGYQQGSLGCNSTCGFSYSLCELFQQCGNNHIDSGEQCDPGDPYAGTPDYGSTTCEDLDQLAIGGTPTCRDDCTFSTTNCNKNSFCGDLVINQGEHCDTTKMGNLTKCSDIGLGGTASLTCKSNCIVDTSTCAEKLPCGNGALDKGEECDGNSLGTLSSSCTSYSNQFTSGTLSCNSCKLVTTSCGGSPSNSQTCGNNVINIGEHCDGTNLGTNMNCEKLGFIGGNLKCFTSGTKKCTLDTSECIPLPKCGNHIIEPGEECDSTNFGTVTTNCAKYSPYYFTAGTITCNPTTCKLDTSSCVEFDAQVSTTTGTITIGNGLPIDLTPITSTGPVTQLTVMTDILTGVLVTYNKDTNTGTVTIGGETFTNVQFTDSDGDGKPDATITLANGERVTIEVDETTNTITVQSDSGSTTIIATPTGPTITGEGEFVLSSTVLVTYNPTTRTGTVSINGQLFPATFSPPDANGNSVATFTLPDGTLVSITLHVGGVNTNLQYCNNGVLDMEEVCDKNTFRGGVSTCSGLDSAQYVSGTLRCYDNCQLNVSGCVKKNTCRNGIIEGTEECEGTNLNGRQKPCRLYSNSQVEWGYGDISCANCKISEAGCLPKAQCDGIRAEYNESCDGNDLKGQTCQTRGFVSGTLTCNSNCNGFDTSGCSTCGNGVVDTTRNEQCDPNPTRTPRPLYRADITGCTYYDIYAGGTLSCNQDCTVNKDSCIQIPTCGNNILDPEEQCDYSSNTALRPHKMGNLTKCADLGMNGGALSCGINCQISTSSCTQKPAVCSNGIKEEGERCDGTDLGSIPSQCSDFSDQFKVGSIRCNPDCKSVSVADCSPKPITTPVCGDGELSGTEECDPNEGNSRKTTCQTLGYSSNKPAGCYPASTTPTSLRCKFDLRGCTLTDASVTYNKDTNTGTVTIGGETFTNVHFTDSDGDGKPDASVTLANGERVTVEVDENTNTITIQTSSGTVTLSTTSGAIFTGTGEVKTLPTTCGNGVINPGEQCDGTNFGLVAKSCAAYSPQYFSAGDLSCNHCTISTSECAPFGGDSANPNYCGNRVLDPGEECDRNGNTPLIDGISTCTGIDSSVYLRGNLNCSTSCAKDFSTCTLKNSCNNGIKEQGEECDKLDFGTASTTCNPILYSSGTITCTNTCTISNNCIPRPICGNGIKESGEICDPAIESTHTCNDETGFVGTTTIPCKEDCSGYDPSGCSKCGNGVLDYETETCDTLGPRFPATINSCIKYEQYIGGTLGCTSCNIDTEHCTDRPGCNNGMLDPGEKCDRNRFGNITKCSDLGLAGGNLKCLENCNLDTSPPTCTPKAAVCHDGVIDAGERCDDNNRGYVNLGNVSDSCKEYSSTFTSGTIGCSSDCKSFSTNNCRPIPSTSTCGNNNLEANEECDGYNLGTTTCSKLTGFIGGTLKCHPNSATQASLRCKFDTSGCIAKPTCGNGVIDINEECDGQNLGNTPSQCSRYAPSYFTSGSISCNECSLDTSGCTKIENLCNNGIKDSGEQCDKNDFGSMDRSCINYDANNTQIFVSGSLTCNSDCEYSTASCVERPPCGNGVKDEGETCDYAAHSPRNCTSVDGGRSFTAGLTSCSTNCTEVYSTCTERIPSCGNGNKERGEECDGDDFGSTNRNCRISNVSDFTGGRLNCTRGCKITTATCLGGGIPLTCASNGTCEIGHSCTSNADCASDVCNRASGTCAQGGCTDGIVNNGEIDVDCAGPCSPCVGGMMCITGNDCLSGICQYGYCKSSLDTCLDGKLSPSEGGIDCGGSCQNKCSANEACQYTTDCESGLACTSGTCTICKEGDPDCGDTSDETVETAIDPFLQWLIENNLNAEDAEADNDEDGLTNREEYGYKTNPNMADTDDDGYTDHEEILAGTNPLDSDDHPSSFLPTLFMILGILVVLVGLGYLLYMQNSKKKVLIDAPDEFSMPHPAPSLGQTSKLGMPEQKGMPLGLSDMFKRKHEKEKINRESVFDKFLGQRTAAEQKMPEQSQEQKQPEPKKGDTPPQKIIIRVKQPAKGKAKDAIEGLKRISREPKGASKQKQKPAQKKQSADAITQLKKLAKKHAAKKK